MSIISDRVAAAIALAGESITFSVAGAQIGIVQALDTGTENTMLDDAEKMGVVHPGIKISLAGSVTIANAQTFTYEGRSFTVLKSFKTHIAGVAVSTLVVAS